MDDVEKMRDVAEGASQDFDPDKTWVVPSTPRPGTAANPGHDPDAEKTQIVRDTPQPPRAARAPFTGEGQYPPAEAHIQYPSTGPNAQRSPMGPPPQYPGAGPALQRPATPPPAQYGPPAGPAPLPGPPPSRPAPMSGPVNYGPPPAAAPGYGPGPQQSGPQQPHGYPPQPDPYSQHAPYGQHDPYAQQPPQAGPYPGQPPQSPLGAANAALAKGGSFITRLIHRGMYGELIKNPWFQQTRQQSPNQFVYISFGIGVILSLIFGQMPGVLGAVLTLALWAGIAYTHFAIGTKKAVQWVAYGICGVGSLINLGGAVLGMLAWSELNSSPYMSGIAGSNFSTMFLVEVISAVVCAALFAWVGIVVHRTIMKLSGQQ